jgi:hypothetical protein
MLILCCDMHMFSCGFVDFSLVHCVAFLNVVGAEATCMTVGHLQSVRNNAFLHQVLQSFT